MTLRTLMNEFEKLRGEFEVMCKKVKRLRAEVTELKKNAKSK